MKYNLDDKPNKLDLFLYGVQWFTAILPFIIILSGVVSSLHTDDIGLKTIYTQKMFIVTGLALIVQILLGHKLPLLLGPATILLIGLISTQNLSAEASYTAIAIGGILTTLLSFGKFFGSIQKIFTSRVVVVTLLLVAFTVAPLIIKLTSEGSRTFANIMFAIVLTLSMILANTYLKGIAKALVILFGIIVGSLGYILLFGAPQHYESIYSINQLFNNIVITPEFNISAIIAFFFCFLALTVNEFGAVQATGRFLGIKNIGERSKKGLRVTGIFNVLSGMFGVIGVVDYSMSPGIISATQSASRYPLIVAGALLVVCAFIPQTVSIFSYIPTVILGSVLLYMMCTQLSSAIQLMVNEKAVSDFNTAITIAFPVMVGLFISFAPQAFTDSIPPVIQPILGNGFIMGMISVLILEFLLNKKVAK